MTTNLGLPNPLLRSLLLFLFFLIILISTLNLLLLPPHHLLLLLRSFYNYSFTYPSIFLGNITLFKRTCNFVFFRVFEGGETFDFGGRGVGGFDFLDKGGRATPVGPGASEKERTVKGLEGVDEEKKGGRTRICRLGNPLRCLV